MPTTIFIDHAKNVFENDIKNHAHPLIDHPQIPIIIDTLARQELHHLFIFSSLSEKLHLPFMQCVADQLIAHPTPKTLKDIYFIYFDYDNFLLTNRTEKQIKQDFLALSEELIEKNKRVIFVLNTPNLFTQQDQSFFTNVIKNLLSDDRWRFIIFAKPEQEKFLTHLKSFSSLYLSKPHENKLIALLKTYRTELENYHQVMISEETFSFAYSMTKNYLTSESIFDKAFELLDTAAARTSSQERADPAAHQPIVTSNVLAHVISSWTHIPVTHLQHNKFQANKFVDAIRKQVFGQDTAVALIGGILQNACIKLHEKTGPLSQFLLVGQSDVGKTLTALTIAEHSFGHKNAVIRVNLNTSTATSLSDIKIFSTKDDLNARTLLEAIKATPYAVVLLENIEHAKETTLELFQSVFEQGYFVDEFGCKFDFQHTIFILTTRKGSDKIFQLTSHYSAQESSKNLDLMQLVLNEHLQEPQQPQHNLSSHEICEEILPELQKNFSASLLQSVNIIPFLPLDYSALEKVVRMKVKALAKQLDVHFSIELNFAPEVIKFLAHEAFWRKPNSKTLEKLLEQHLYTCVTHEILSQAENKNRPKRLLVQLNDSGQLLRCEFVTSNEATLYNL